MKGRSQDRDLRTDYSESLRDNGQHRARALVREGDFTTANIAVQLYIHMKYERDECKNEANQKKHGVSFAVAALAFEDENCLIRRDRVDETGEQRLARPGECSGRSRSGSRFDGCPRI